MIFGGIVPAAAERSAEADSSDEDESPPQQDPQSQVLLDNGTRVNLSAQSLILDVTVGSIKSGPELGAPSYFVSGGYKMLHSNQVLAFGLGLPPSYL